MPQWYCSARRRAALLLAAVLKGRRMAHPKSLCNVTLCVGSCGFHPRLPHHRPRHHTTSTLGSTLQTSAAAPLRSPHACRQARGPRLTDARRSPTVRGSPEGCERVHQGRMPHAVSCCAVLCSACCSYLSRTLSYHGAEFGLVSIEVDPVFRWG